MTNGFHKKNRAERARKKAHGGRIYVAAKKTKAKISAKKSKKKK